MGSFSLKDALLISCISLFLSALSIVAIDVAHAQQAPPDFGGAFSGLDERRQRLVHDWVARVGKTTGKTLEAGPFYDNLPLSTKTTFEAVTHALMTTPLTDPAGARLGDALALVEHVESVRGELAGASGDRQFRMYVRLTTGAVDTLSRAQQFKRGADNTVYHKGYPANYREQGEEPSIQLSVAVDGQHADIDVDYRASSFPASLVNGHLTSSNSDVRAGDNYDRHVARWTGFENWWSNFFGDRQESVPEVTPVASARALATTPRAGKKNIDVMADDFLKAWLVEGNTAAAMGYISERSYACLAQDSDNPSDFDRGVAPFQIMLNLKSTHDSLGPRSSLEGVILATSPDTPGLRAVRHTRQLQFAIYEVPDSVGATFDCESRVTIGDPPKTRRGYGRYYAATFSFVGRRDHPVVLLWAKEDGYWKIVSWHVGSNDRATPLPESVPESKPVRISADPIFVQSARTFLESWVLRKNFDAAFSYLSPKSYGCYDLERSQEAAASTSLEDAGRKLRQSLEVSGKSWGALSSLEALLSPADPVHPAIRVMVHPNARVFSLFSVPDAMADGFECAARASGTTPPDPMPLNYGASFGMTMRFKTHGGEAPVLQLLWRRDNDAWRITAYAVQVP